MHLLEELIETFRAQNIEVYFSGVRGPVRDQMESSGIVEEHGHHRFFMNQQMAVDYIDNPDPDKKGQKPYASNTLQTNKKWYPVSALGWSPEGNNWW